MDWTIWTPAPDVTAWPWPIAPASVVCRLTSNCQPIPASRIRTRDGRQFFHTKAYAAHLELLSWTWKSVYRGQPVAGALGIRIFFFRRTRATVDRDNLAKAVQDSGKGIVWIDDHQIVEGTDRVFYDPDRPRTEAVVYRTLA